MLQNLINSDKVIVNLRQRTYAYYLGGGGGGVILYVTVISVVCPHCEREWVID